VNEKKKTSYPLCANRGSDDDDALSFCESMIPLTLSFEALRQRGIHTCRFDICPKPAHYKAAPSFGAEEQALMAETARHVIKGEYRITRANGSLAWNAFIAELESDVSTYNPVNVGSSFGFHDRYAVSYTSNGVRCVILKMPHPQV